MAVLKSTTLAEVELTCTTESELESTRSKARRELGTSDTNPRWNCFCLVVSDAMLDVLYFQNNAEVRCSYFQ